MKLRNIILTIVMVLSLITAGYVVTVYVLSNETTAPQIGAPVRHELEIGRDDVDIQSKRTYVFNLPASYSYQVHGVDAQSLELWFFNQAEEQVMTVVVYDHTNVNWIAPDPHNTQVAGHTIMITQVNDPELLSWFKKTLRVNGQEAYHDEMKLLN